MHKFFIFNILFIITSTFTWAQPKEAVLPPYVSPKAFIETVVARMGWKAWPNTTKAWLVEDVPELAGSGNRLTFVYKPPFGYHVAIEHPHPKGTFRTTIHADGWWYVDEAGDFDRTDLPKLNEAHYPLPELHWLYDEEVVLELSEGLFQGKVVYQIRDLTPPKVILSTEKPTPPVFYYDPKTLRRIAQSYQASFDDPEDATAFMFLEDYTELNGYWYAATKRITGAKVQFKRKVSMRIPQNVDRYFTPPQKGK